MTIFLCSCLYDRYTASRWLKRAHPNEQHHNIPKMKSIFWEWEAGTGYWPFHAFHQAKMISDTSVASYEYGHMPNKAHISKAQVFSMVCTVYCRFLPLRVVVECSPPHGKRVVDCSESNIISHPLGIHWNKMVRVTRQNLPGCLRAK